MTFRIAAWIACRRELVPTRSCTYFAGEPWSRSSRRFLATSARWLFARLYIEVNRVDRDERAEPLGDGAELEDGGHECSREPSAVSHQKKSDG